VKELTHIDLFSGIGGFALAARWAGIQTVQFVEIDKFCQQVLRKNFPGVPIHDDIKTFTNAKCSRFNGQTIPIQSRESQQEGSLPTGCNQRPFLLTGGFPCQPFSCAGKRKGTGDDRHLWPHMLRVIKEVNPEWIIGENVGGIINIKNLVEQGGDVNMEDEADNGAEDSGSTSVLVSILSDLNQAGYSVQLFLLPACAVNAPHRRDRVWIVGHSEGSGKCVGQQERMDREVFSQTGRKQGSVNPTSPDSNTFNPGITSESTRTENNDWEALSPCKPDCHAPDTEKSECESSGRTWTGRKGLADGSEFIADTETARLEGRDTARPGCANGRLTEHAGGIGQDKAGSWEEQWLEAATRLCRVDDGLSEELHKLETSDRVGRLKALGNAVVPQIPYLIMKAILEES